MARLLAESRDVLLWMPEPQAGPDLPPPDAHAGRTETALQLALTPYRVRSGLAEAGNTEPLPGLMPALRAGGIRAVSPNGVLGDGVGFEVAENAAVVLGNVGGPQALPALRRALGDAEPLVREAAAWAIRRIEDRSPQREQGPSDRRESPLSRGGA